MCITTNPEIIHHTKLVLVTCILTRRSAIHASYQCGMDGKRSNLSNPETSKGTLEYPNESFLIMEGGPVNSKGMDGKRSNELGPTGPGPVSKLVWRGNMAGPDD